MNKFFKIFLKLFEKFWFKFLIEFLVSGSMLVIYYVFKKFLPLKHRLSGESFDIILRKAVAFLNLIPKQDDNFPALLKRSCETLVQINDIKSTESIQVYFKDFSLKNNLNLATDWLFLNNILKFLEPYLKCEIVDKVCSRSI